MIKLARFIGLVALLAALSLAIPAQAAPQVIYDDILAASWANWSWASVNLSAATPVHSGTKSIAVTYTGGWQGLYLAHPYDNPNGARLSCSLSGFTYASRISRIWLA